MTRMVGEGGNFVATMAALADRGERPAVVADQVGHPTFTSDLADGTAHRLATGAPFGTYNLTDGGGPMSWADLAAAVFEARGRPANDVRRVTSAEYFADKPDAAPRPSNSVLDLSKITATGCRPRDWRTALADYLASHPGVAAGAHAAWGTDTTPLVTEWSRLAPDLPMIRPCGGSGSSVD